METEDLDVLESIKIRKLVVMNLFKNVYKQLCSILHLLRNLSLGIVTKEHEILWDQFTHANNYSIQVTSYGEIIICASGYLPKFTIVVYRDGHVYIEKEQNRFKSTTINWWLTRRLIRFAENRAVKRYKYYG